MKFSILPWFQPSTHISPPASLSGLIWESRQYCNVTIPEIQYRIYTILDVPVSCIYNTGISELLIYAQYRKLQYSSSNNTGNTSIVKHMILEAPVFFILRPTASYYLSNLYRGPSIDASYQVSDHLEKQFRRRRFLEIDQSETRIACDGHVC
jgi:hypothetical protein